MNPFTKILVDIFVVIATAFVLMLIRAIKSANEADCKFVFADWIVMNYNRFICLLVIGVLVPILLGVSPGFNILLGEIGIDAQKSPVLMSFVGASIAGFLLTVFKTQKPKDTPELPAEEKKEL